MVGYQSMALVEQFCIIIVIIVYILLWTIQMSHFSPLKTNNSAQFRTVMFRSYSFGHLESVKWLFLLTMHVFQFQQRWSLTMHYLACLLKISFTLGYKRIQTGSKLILYFYIIFFKIFVLRFKKCNRPNDGVIIPATKVLILQSWHC